MLLSLTLLTDLLLLHTGTLFLVCLSSMQAREVGQARLGGHCAPQGTLRTRAHCPPPRTLCPRIGCRGGGTSCPPYILKGFDQFLWNLCVNISYAISCCGPCVLYPYYLSDRQVGDDRGRTHELEQSAVKCMRGLLFCYMRQADKVC